jgi:RNA polymerase sigma factor (sigma-70 family)
MPPRPLLTNRSTPPTPSDVSTHVVLSIYMTDETTKDELRDLLADHLQRLPSSERRVLFRRLFHQPPMSSRDIGHDLGITEGRARHLELRALRRLRSLAPDPTGRV